MTNDNIEINAMADVVALYVLFDDSPLRCAHYYCSAPGDENRTEIFVVPQTEFGTWIVDAKKYKGKAVVLHESIPKNTKNICNFNSFLGLAGYIDNQRTEAVDLSGFQQIGGRGVCVKESSHQDVRAHTLRRQL
jgi:hypothetical protein